MYVTLPHSGSQTFLGTSDKQSFIIKIHLINNKLLLLCFKINDRIVYLYFHIKYRATLFYNIIKYSQQKYTNYYKTKINIMFHNVVKSKLMLITSCVCKKEEEGNGFLRKRQGFSNGSATLRTCW